MHIRKEDRNPDLYTEMYDRWENEGWYVMYSPMDFIRFKKRHTNRDSKVRVLSVKTVAIPTEIEFEGRVYVLKEGVC